jgi:DNA-binding HxlR family transcriptional regulator
MKESIKLCTKYQTVFEWLGKKWNGLILKCLESGPLRFNDIGRCIEQCSDKVLTERLKELEHIGLIEYHIPYYQLSEMGKELTQSLSGVQTFAEKHL